MNQKYKIITTEDSTVSLYSEEYQQAMHSVSGAYEEALLKHVLPGGLLDSHRPDMNVLDIGSGIGYNMLALIYESRKRIPRPKVKIISLEKDFAYLSLMKKINFGDERDYIYKIIIMAFETGHAVYDNCELELRRGDARQTICSIDDIFFDAVFHDPYSPARNPELWTVDFFLEVRRRTFPHGILTTYSSASQIRSALLEAGFKIGKGPSVGKKREGTLASADGNIPCMNGDEIAALKDNIKSVPYRDCDLKGTRDEILQRRIDEMRILRARGNPRARR
ncbi:MAG: MnmC family methyltransferase [Spirochaetes bacterium]|nr:MnmC family methyltransferase [Spirochaetota bacterium]